MAARQHVQIVITARDLTRRAFRRIGRALRNIRFQMASLIGGVGFAQMTRDALAFGAAVDSAARRVQLSAEETQLWMRAAEILGVTFNQFAMVAQRTLRRVSEALGGNRQVLEAFAKLGIDQATLQRTKDFSEALRLTTVMAERAAGNEGAFARIVDSEGLALVGQLRVLPEAIAQAGAELRRTGGILSGEDAAELAAATAEFKAVWLGLRVEFSRLVTEILPPLTEAANTLLRAFRFLSRTATGRAGGAQSMAQSAQAQAQAQAELQRRQGFAGQALSGSGMADALVPMVRELVKIGQKALRQSGATYD